MLSIRISHMFSMSYYFFSIRRACSVLLSSFVPPGRTYRTQPAAASETPDQLAERLLTTYGNSILRLAYAYLHNMADAEEILQETLLQFFQKPPAGPFPFLPHGWESPPSLPVQGHRPPPYWR